MLRELQQVVLSQRFGPQVSMHQADTAEAYWARPLPTQIGQPQAGSVTYHNSLYRPRSVDQHTDAAANVFREFQKLPGQVYTDDLGGKHTTAVQPVEPP